MAQNIETKEVWEIEAESVNFSYSWNSMRRIVDYTEEFIPEMDQMGINDLIIGAKNGKKGKKIGKAKKRKKMSQKGKTINIAGSKKRKRVIDKSKSETPKIIDTESDSESDGAANISVKDGM